MIRSGTTCYNDMYYFMDETARATKEMGLRAFLSAVLFDMRPDLIDDVEPFIRRWKGDNLIVPAVGPHAVYTCSEETLSKAMDLDRKARRDAPHPSLGDEVGGGELRQELWPKPC